jgi:hypothetical protein
MFDIYSYTWYTSLYRPILSHAIIGNVLFDIYSYTWYVRLYRPILSHAIIGNVLFDIYSYTWYVSLYRPILSHVIIGNVLFDIYSYTWYVSLRGLSQNVVVPSLAILTFCLLGYVSSTSSVWTMLEYCFAFFGHIDTLPLELFASWAALPPGLASWAILPLGLLCLLGLPLGPLCLLGCFASWACLLGYFNMLPLGHVSSTLSALTMPVYRYTSWAVPSLGTC